MKYLRKGGAWAAAGICWLVTLIAAGLASMLTEHARKAELMHGAIYAASLAVVVALVAVGVSKLSKRSAPAIWVFVAALAAFVLGAAIHPNAFYALPWWNTRGFIAWAVLFAALAVCVLAIKALRPARSKRRKPQSRPDRLRAPRTRQPAPAARRNTASDRKSPSANRRRASSGRGSVKGFSDSPGFLGR